MVQTVTSTMLVMDTTTVKALRLTVSAASIRMKDKGQGMQQTCD